MKKITLLSLLLFLSSTSYSFAQTPTEVISPTTTLTNSTNNDSLTEKINDLKDKIASRVAQLNLVEKRGIIGTVTNKTSTQITVKDINDTTRSIDVDEITKFYSAGQTNFGISDIENNTVIGAVGIYNKQSKRILARYIDVVNLPQVLSGVVTNADEDEFTLTVATENKKNYTVDVERITKTNEYTEEDGVVKSGFSEIRIGERIIVTGYKNKEEKDRVTATRILLFPGYPKNPKIDVNVTPEPTEEETTPTSSPRTRTTPSPTRRNTQ